MGFVGNINYLQMIDLAAGLVGLDVCGDDGLRYGLWPGQTGYAPSEQAAELRKQAFDLPSRPQPGAKPAAKGGWYWGRGHNPMPPSAVAAPAKPAAEPKKAEEGK